MFFLSITLVWIMSGVPTFSTEDDPRYSNRLSVGTLQGQIVRGDHRRRLLSFCCQLCCKPPPEAQEEKAVICPPETMRPLKQSRSCNTLCTDHTPGQTNGFKTTSRSTDDLLQDMKSK